MSSLVRYSLFALATLAVPVIAGAEPAFVNALQIPGAATDLSGLPSAAGNNRLGGFASDLFYDAGRNVYFGIPDRGPGGGLISFDTRVQAFTLDVDLGTGRISNFLLTETIVFKDALGQPFTGLNPGLSNGNSSVLGRSFDPEGLVVGANGHFYVSDEYGPSVYEFGADGTLLRSFTAPSNLIPRDAAGQTNFVDGRPVIVTGRQDNRGFEGLTMTPDGTRLLAVLQDPLVDEGAQNDGRRSGNVRIVAFDAVTGKPVAQYIYPLEALASINDRVPGATFSATSLGRNIGVSAIYALSDHEFLVLERDNRGLGIDDPTASNPVASKRVYRIDIAGATDVSGVSLAGTNTLPAGVVPVTKTATPFLDIASALRAAGLTLPEKIEGLTVGPQLNDGGYLLLLGTDNDFSVTQTGAGAQLDVCFGGALAGTQVPIGDACPAGSGLLPTNLYAFRTAPGALAPAPAVPEPGAWALLAGGVAAVLRRRWQAEASETHRPACAMAKGKSGGVSTSDICPFAICPFAICPFAISHCPLPFAIEPPVMQSLPGSCGVDTSGRQYCGVEDNTMAARRSRVGTFAPGRQFDDVTLWTMERHGHVARCALSWRSDAWELRVLMDDDLLLSERCRMQVELFAVAGGWRDRLRERGWSQPAAAPPVIEAADDWRALTPS